MQTKIVQINSTCGVGSTGKIAVAISELFTQQGVENNILFSTATNGYGLGIACGTPVVTFNTGGSPEMLDSTCGSVVPKNDIDGIYNEIKRVCETQPYSKDDCLKRAESFDKNLRFTEYLNLLVKH